MKTTWTVWFKGPAPNSVRVQAESEAEAIEEAKRGAEFVSRGLGIKCPVVERAAQGVYPRKFP